MLEPFLVVYFSPPVDCLPLHARLSLYLSLMNKRSSYQFSALRGGKKGAEQTNRMLLRRRTSHDKPLFSSV